MSNSVRKLTSFAIKKIGIFQARFIAFTSVEFPKICRTVKHICALPSAVSIKQIEMEGENTKLHIARKLPL